MKPQPVTNNESNKTMQNNFKMNGTDSIIQPICDNFQYWSLDQFGMPIRYQSTNQGMPWPLHAIPLMESFVSNTIKSADLPFVFDKTLAGTELLRINSLGREIYSLFATPYRLEFPKYEASEYAKLFLSVAERLNLAKATISNNPMAMVSADGVREGEYLNALVIRLREAAGKNNFQHNLKQRRIDCKKWASRTQRLIQRLLENHPGLCVFTVDLQYQPHRTSEIRLRDAANHFENYQAGFESSLGLEAPVGHIWFRNYLPEVGYRTQLIYFVDPRKMQDFRGVVTYLADLWSEVTQDQGMAIVPWLPERVTDQVVSAIKQAIMSTAYLRLAEGLQYMDHIGTSDIPNKQVSTVMPALGTYPINFLPQSSSPF